MYAARVSSEWRLDPARADHAARVGGIVGHRFEARHLELRQVDPDPPEANVRGVAPGLQPEHGEQANQVATLMLDHLTRRPTH